MTRTFVIAEAAACHDGDMQKAERLVHLAKEIGADACKFQWTSNPERLVERRHAPEYRKAYSLLAFPPAWHAVLALGAQAHGIEYMCTVYLPEDIPAVAPYVSRFKIASFEAGDTKFINAHRRYPKDILVSTGMAATPPYDVIRLHCVSAYPCPDDQANLAAIRQSGGLLHGYSDHTTNPLTGALAVAAGARFIEFHIRLDDTDPANADFAVARDPLKASTYVRNIRQAETLLGDGVKQVMESERPMLHYRVRP